MKLVVLDSQAVNPGDLSWDWLKAFGEVAVYPRTRRKRWCPGLGMRKSSSSIKSP